MKVMNFISSPFSTSLKYHFSFRPSKMNLKCFFSLCILYIFIGTRPISEEPIEKDKCTAMWQPTQDKTKNVLTNYGWMNEPFSDWKFHSRILFIPVREWTREHSTEMFPRESFILWFLFMLLFMYVHMFWGDMFISMLVRK